MPYATPQRTSPGGRGARERILQAATTLFYAHGINVTGVEQLATVAQVSKRTLYQHFASKEAIVEAYLHHLAQEGHVPTIAALDRADLSPRERLLALFDALAPETDQTARGCPYVNACVEVAAPGHPAHELAARYKRGLIERLTQTAAEAGARDPAALARQLAVLHDGAAAQGTVLNSAEPARAARAAAWTLLEAAIVDAAIATG